MARKIAIALVFVALISILIGIKLREYKRDFLFEKALLAKLEAIEAKQDAILNRPGFAVNAAAARPQRPVIDPNKIYRISVGQSPVKGDPEAKVTIVEFSDFQCRFSQRFHPIALEAAGSYSKGVAYVFKGFPLGFHPQARAAVKALWAAKEQGKYWEMMDLLMKTPDKLAEGKFSDLAKQAGLDVGRFEKDLKEKDAQWEKIIEADLAAAKDAEVMGTPTFYINGKRTEARSLEEFKKQIDQLLK